MKKIILSGIVIIVLLLSGCASTKIGTPQIVEVPITTKCNPTIKITPIEVYPFDNAKKEMSLFEKSQLALAELNLVKAQNKELTAALTECTK